MGKGMESKKEAKKPSKTIKEKRAIKEAKRKEKGGK